MHSSPQGTNDKVFYMFMFFKNNLLTNKTQF